MVTPRVVSRTEWNQEREALLKKEKEVTRARDKVSAQRRRLPMVKIDKPYEFEGPDGHATLIDLFEGRRQLIVYHFMFHPDWDEGCDGCSFLVDNIGHLSHLHAANTTLAIVARAPLSKTEPFRARMGWSVPWYSSFGSDFNEDFGVTMDDMDQPGTSVFYREGSAIYHTYSTFARGGEILLNTFNFLDLTPLGRQEEAGIMNWVRLHDQYGALAPVPAHHALPNKLEQQS
jgi:predicted dithiol-disulfide oxidoreductase (DUF899 family)